MTTLTEKKSVFEMDNAEFKELVKPVAAKAKETAMNNGAWFSYQNELCTEATMFVHEYKDGHKELIKLGNEPGKFELLKVF